MRFWVLVVLAGCYKPTFTEGLPCSEDGNCPEGQMCELTSMTCNGTPVAGDGPGIDVPMGDELILAFAFEELAGGKIDDRSTFGNDAGLLDGAQAMFGPVKYDNGLLFPAALNLSYRVEPSPELDLGGGALTMSLWIDSDMVGTNLGVVVEKRMNDGGTYEMPFVQYNLEVSEDVYFAHVGGADGTLPAKCAFSATNGLHHFAFTYDSDDGFRGYLDGKPVEPIPGNCIDGKPTIASRPDSPLLLGKAGNDGERFVGSIDNLRIYNRVLTPAEIEADMATPIP